MSLATLVGTVAGFLAATGSAASLWHAAQRQVGPLRHAYWWFAGAALLLGANAVLGQTVSLPAGAAGAMLSFADLPALLVLPVMAAGLAALAAVGRAASVDPPPPRRTRRGLATESAYAADGYILASALFLVGWVTLFGPAFARSGQGPGAFAVELIHPLTDLVFLGATLAAARLAGRPGLLPYLALALTTASDSLAVGARVSGAHPGVAALLVQLAALVLLGLTPRSSGRHGAGIRWLGSTWGVTTTVAAVAAAAAAVLVTAQAIVSDAFSRPVVLIILGTTALALAFRVTGLSRRVNSWSRVWQQSGRQFRQLAERTSDVVLLCDLDGSISYASRAVADYGYAQESLRQKALLDLVHPEDRAGGIRAVRRAVAGDAQRVGRYPCRVRAADGTWRHVESTVSRYRDPGGPDQLLVTARDMSAQVALRRQVTHLTSHDGLTGLPNRAYVEQRAHDVLSQAGPGDSPQPLTGETAAAAAIVVDMDNFTAVIDAAGHSAADLLLAQIARRLRMEVSSQNTVARWGGDEFAVLVERAGNPEEIFDIAERLARGVASLPFRVGSSDVTLTASVGVALADGSPARQIWRNAEMAVGRAKSSGGGRAELFVNGAAGESANAGDTGAPKSRVGGAGSQIADIASNSAVSHDETKLLSS
jgi:diguanylate cyclase (GGDEF)-like protein/PAS domain S-box-containing protein